MNSRIYLPFFETIYLLLVEKVARSLFRFTHGTNDILKKRNHISHPCMHPSSQIWFYISFVLNILASIGCILTLIFTDQLVDEDDDDDDCGCTEQEVYLGNSFALAACLVTAALTLRFVRSDRYATMHENQEPSSIPRRWSPLSNHPTKPRRTWQSICKPKKTKTVRLRKRRELLRWPWHSFTYRNDDT